VGFAMVKTERRSSHTLGNRVVDGAQLRSVPPIEQPWITTFNLRWWSHLTDEGSRRIEEKPTGMVGLPD
jgi:hypothetical protein